MTDEKAREIATALSQNLFSFHKGRRTSARTPITANIQLVHNQSHCLGPFKFEKETWAQ
jgi:hypothetical protein